MCTLCVKYHAIPCNTMKYHAIPSNTMKYHAIPCNTIEYNTIPAVRIDNCAGWRAWNPDAGSAGWRASRLAACHRNSLQSLLQNLLQNLLITIRFETAPWGNTRVGVTTKTVFSNPWRHWCLAALSPFSRKSHSHAGLASLVVESLNLDQPSCCSEIVPHIWVVDIEWEEVESLKCKFKFLFVICNLHLQNLKDLG